jgi:hypothetical protein
LEVPYQLQLWAKQSAAYQAWQNDPRTNQMKEFSLLLNSQQVQARMTAIQPVGQQLFQRSYRHKGSAVSI